MWVQEFLNVLCLQLTATDVVALSDIVSGQAEWGRTVDEREGENERLVLLAFSSHVDFAKSIYFCIALE